MDAAPPELSLADLVALAKRILAAPATARTREDARTVLTEIVAYLGPEPSPAEAKVLAAAGQAPAAYAAIPVGLALNPQIPMCAQPVQTPSGPVDMLVAHFALTIPLASLRASTVLGPDGNAQNPLDGIVPMIEGRLLIPRARLSASMQAALRTLGAPEPAGPDGTAGPRLNLSFLGGASGPQGDA